MGVGGGGLSSGGRTGTLLLRLLTQRWLGQAPGCGRDGGGGGSHDGGLSLAVARRQ